MRRLHALTALLLATRLVAFDSRGAVRNAVARNRFLMEIAENTFKQEFTSDYFFSVISSHQNALDSLSQECREDLSMILISLNDTAAYPGFEKSVLIPMLDSNGKKGPAIQQGHLYFAGHYSQCTAVDYVVEGRERHFKGEYFRIDIDLFFRPNSHSDSCGASLEGYIPFWEVGLCLPASCTSAELLSLFKSESGATIDNPVCQFTRPGDLTPDIGAGFYITLSIMGVIVAVCVISGFVDFYFTERLKNTSLSKSLGWQLFMACSIYSNIASIFDISESAKEGQIGPIHSIRFFSMMWVLEGHLLSSYLVVINNPNDILAMAKDLFSEIVTNGFYSVDSFFFMSGVLLTFLWFKFYNQNPKQVNSVLAWVMLYIHRILRLSPAFYIVVIFTTFVLKQIIRSTPLSMNQYVVTDSCSSTWWLEFLYVHNWIDNQTPVQCCASCLDYSWYLASEMQMFLFTPVIIIPLAIKPLLGLIVAAVFVVASTAANIFLVCYYHWPAGSNAFYPADPEQTNMENYGMLMYDNPAIRCQIYIMGMIVGWFLQTRKTLKLHPIIYLSWWLIGLSLMFTVVLGLHDQTNGTVIPIFWRAMYSSLSRPAWGIGLSTILILCYYGYGGPINSFMSWHIWVPLGRLSYSGYLIHVPMIQLVLSQTMDEVYFSTAMEFIQKLLLGGMRAPKSNEATPIIKEEKIP